MKTLTEKELIAIGLQVQEARRKGGKVVLEKYGSDHFKKLRQIGLEKQRKAKIEAKDAP